ncbi:MAG: hypothetical protein R2710_12420 [Acidimicrobiales bacterium]
MLGLSASPTMLRAARPVKTGTLMQCSGSHAEVAGIDVGIGDLVLMGDDRGPTEPVIGEVVALDETAATVLPYGHLRAALSEPFVVSAASSLAPVGHGLLDRVIDGRGIRSTVARRSASPIGCRSTSIRRRPWTDPVSPNRFRSASAPSTRCCRAAEVSESASSPAPVSASRACSRCCCAGPKRRSRCWPSSASGS